MNNEFLLEILDENWEQKPVSSLKKPLKEMLKALPAKKYLSENRVFEKELLSLISEKSSFLLTFYDEKKLVLGEAVCALQEITTENVILTAEKLSATKYITNMDVELLLFSVKFSIIKNAIEKTKTELEGKIYLNKLYSVLNLDFVEINKTVNPLHRKFSQDELYCASTDETKALYRRKLSLCSISTHIPEERLAFEVCTRSKKDNIDIGTLIFRDYRRVFPHGSVEVYIKTFVWISVALAALISFFTFPLLIFALILPCAAIIKPFVDHSTSKYAKAGDMLPRLNLEGKIPENAKTLCVISTLFSDKESIKNVILRMKKVKIKNPAENIFFCILADLSPAKTVRDTEDRSLISFARKMLDENFSDSVIIVRERSFSKTQNVFQGWERKRGAIEQLVRFLKGERIVFREIIGNKGCLSEIKNIVALDYDTMPLMDSIEELVGIAEHPLNKRIGIFAPRITTTLSSSLKTTFSRIMAGNGGSSNISSYDSFAGEFYNDCFGEGIFTGKGLIRVNTFYEKCCKFPEESVLSHDILEGEKISVAFAGDIEFSDSFPPSSKGYFKRLERWLRGDFQNVAFLKNEEFSTLSKFKLYDNIRRGVTPIFTLSLLFLSPFWNNGWLLILTSIAAVIMPYILSLSAGIAKAGQFSITRQFYSPLIPQSRLFFSQSLMELIMLPKYALVSISAFFKTVWRRNFSHKNLLQWTTSSVFDKTDFSFSHLIGAEILALILFVISIVFGKVFLGVVSALLLCQFPVLIFADVATEKSSAKLNSKAAFSLTENARKMWSFYDDFVTFENNYLPPDNVQYSPVYRVCERTSPTNIGMYMASIICAEIFGFISKKELEQKISDTMETIEKMEKWNGNLYNWYQTTDLKIVSSFVSTVDSGNFICCLVVVKEALKQNRCSEKLISRVEKIISETDFAPFYNSTKNLFSIGFETDKNKLSEHHYDLLMSEARMTSYFAIAMGYAPKKHWRSLGRTMSRTKFFAGPAAWTGTMFEFFMPELMLDSKEGSLSYEALKFAIHCQKKRGREMGTPYGISESGYFAFDNNLNYQYKANGVQKNGLKSGLNLDRVVSPYSSFLTLQTDFYSSYNNLVRIENLGAVHEKYGFYEAIDFTPKRVGENRMAIVKSHMAHHVGMSILGLTNALYNNRIKQLFMGDEKMKKAEELLEEHIVVGEKILDIKDDFSEEKNAILSEQEFSNVDILNPRINLISNGSLSVLCYDNGVCEGYYSGKSTVVKSPDFLRRPRGMFFGFLENEDFLPFASHPVLEEEWESENCQKSIVFRQNSTEYFVNKKMLRSGMKIFLDKNIPAEIRHFEIENSSSVKRQITLCGYIEPALAKYADLKAHPAFMDMFLSLEFDKENLLLIAKRRERHGPEERYMCVGFTEKIDFTFSFDKEEIIEQNKTVFSAFKKGAERASSTVSVPSPCIFVKADFALDAHSCREAKLFICYGKSKEEVLSFASSVRKSKTEECIEVISPLAADTIHGRMSSRLLPYLALRKPKNKEIYSAIINNNLDKRALWRFSISGENPIVIFDGKDGIQSTTDMLFLSQSLKLCGLPFDLIFLCENTAQKTAVEKASSENNIPVFALNKEVLEEEILTLIIASSIYIFTDKNCEEEDRIERNFIIPKRSKPITEDENHFGDGFYVVAEETPNIWSNIIANPQFGTLVSSTSLGFTWAINSRENKLSPWLNDISRHNDGELLILKNSKKYYDVINGSTAVFSANSAVYNSAVGDIQIRTEISVPQKGMSKEITLEILNRGSGKKTAELCYYIEPVLAAFRENSALIKPIKKENTLIFSNPENQSIKGCMTISSNKTSRLLTDKNMFWTGNWEECIAPSFQPCGAVIIPLDLPPKSKEKIKFILSFTANKPEPLSLQKATENIKSYELKAENKITVKTPSKTLNQLFNTWLPWQTLGCRIYGRTAFYQNGGAYGFRDQLQDTLASVYLYPKVCERQIYRACASQFPEGDVLHWWHDLMGLKKGVRTRYSDDLLWLPYTVFEYVEKTGNKNILDKKIAYINGELLKKDEQEKYLEVSKSEVKESVYSHCKKAVEKAYSLGRNGLLKIGCGDWNDGYNNVGVKGKGESVWLSMFYIMVAERTSKLAEIKNDIGYAEELQKRVSLLTTAILENAWDGEYYLRAFYDDGSKMGSQHSDLCKIDLLPQAFATLCSLPDAKKNITALNSAISTLVDSKNGIIKLFSPAFEEDKTMQRPGYVMAYPKGLRENGGQYTHAAIWFTMACYRMLQNETAFKLIEMLNPALKGSSYKNEPYYISADIYTNPACYGRGGWSMYTGAAAWYYKCILEELFGVCIADGKIKFNPKIPNEWHGFEMNVLYQGTSMKITCKKGETDKILIDEKEQEYLELDGKNHNIEIFLR